MLGIFGESNKKQLHNIASLIDVGTFIIITLIFHKLWWHYAAEIKSVTAVINTANWLAHQVFQSSFWLIHHFIDPTAHTEPVNTILINNGYIAVNESCSGLKQFYQIMVLFLLFPGPWKHKLWFIPMSIIIMHITNIFRIVALGIVLLWIPDYWHFIHDWILRPFFYVVIFMLWVWWVERFGGFGRMLRKRVSDEKK